MGKLDFKELPEMVSAPEFFIGVDAYDQKVFSYCLCRHIVNETTVVLPNTRHNKNEFDEEVKNLAKYFNAKILEEDV